MAIVDIRNAIIRMEGVNPNFVANNNPGNIVYNFQHPEYTPGAIGPGAGGFAKYPSYDAGVADLDRQIQIDASRGLTLDQFVNKYAPSSENDTSIYLSNMMTWLKAGASDKLSSLISSDGVVAASNASSDVIDSINNVDSTTLGIVAAIVVGGLVIYSATG